MTVTTEAMKRQTCCVCLKTTTDYVSWRPPYSTEDDPRSFITAVRTSVTIDAPLDVAAHTHPHGPICSESWCGSPRKDYSR